MFNTLQNTSQVFIREELKRLFVLAVRGQCIESTSTDVTSDSIDL